MFLYVSGWWYLYVIHIFFEKCLHLNVYKVHLSFYSICLDGELQYAMQFNAIFLQYYFILIYNSSDISSVLPAHPRLLSALPLTHVVAGLRALGSIVQWRCSEICGRSSIAPHHITTLASSWHGIEAWSTRVWERWRHPGRWCHVTCYCGPWLVG